MNIAETPIAAILRGQRATGDGVHLVARTYQQGVRLGTHMHREAQLVYAAKGTMQVTTPKGRWLVPPDRAVWVPARLEHAIDVLADIEMRTLYFDLTWLAREQRSDSVAAEFVVRVSPLLQHFGAVRRQQQPRAYRALGQIGRARTASRRGFHDLHSAAARAALPARRRHRARRPHRFA
jgi:mannose-6-phosphate isomerase-like protein (cupin superfamily)